MKNETRALLLFLGDILIFVLSFFIMLSVGFPDITETVIKLHFYPFIFLSALGVLIFFIFDLYDTEISKPTIPPVRQVMNGFIVTTLLSILFFYTITFFKITPKTNLFVFYLSALIL